MIDLKTKNWEIKNIETILLDKDGTIIDLHYFWGRMTELRVNEIIKKYNISENLFSELCLSLGYNTEEQLMLSDGITALYSREKIIKIFKEDLKKYNINSSTNEIEEIFDSVSSIFYRDMQKYTKPILPAINFVKKVRSKGIKIGIVTSDSKESTLLTVKHFNWENLFDAIIGRESTTENKESGIPTRLALKKLNANPKSTIMIGDAPMDFISAKNAGIEKTILVSTGQIKKEELKKTSNLVVSSLDEIIIK